MIKKIHLLCILFIAILSSCNTSIKDKKEQATNDSIKKYLDLVATDTMTYDKIKEYNDKAYALLDLHKKDTTSLNNLYRIGFNFYRLNDLNKLKPTADSLLKKSIQIKDKFRIGLGHKLLGLYHMNISENEKALVYFFKAKKAVLSFNKYSDAIGILHNISLTQYYAGDFLGSNKTIFEIFKLRKNYQSYLKDENLYNQLGNNLANLKQDDKAIEYYKKIDKKKINLRFKNVVANNISSSYIELHKYQDAYDELAPIVNSELSKKINPTNYATAMSLFGYCKLKMNKTSGLPSPFYKAEEMFKANNSTNGRNYNLVYLSMYYEKIKDTTNAIIYAKKALQLSREYNNPSDILATLKQMLRVDKTNASKYGREYIKVNDSLQIAERNFRDKFARIAYETDEITQEKEKAVHQKWIIAGISTCITLIVVLLLIITRQRSKQKELRLRQEQQSTNEEIYQLMLGQKIKEEEVRQNEKKRIALELHDGIMNKLASTRLNLGILSHKTDEATIQKCLKYVDDIYQIEQDIRIVSHDLNHEAFQNEESFIKMLDDFVKQQNKSFTTHFELELDIEIDWNNISSVLKMHLYRIIQEASHNINKHAKAKKAIITIALDYPNICMSITDDGIGFDKTATHNGIGIQNMQTRVKFLNGKFNINSIANHSTSIIIAVPMLHK